MPTKTNPIAALSGDLNYPNTTFSYDGLWNDVYLYKTKIMSFNGGYAAFMTGAYPTVLTLRRMNQISRQFGLGIRIFKVKGVLFGQRNSEPAVPFKDGRLFIPRATAEAVDAPKDVLRRAEAEAAQKRFTETARRRG